MKVVKLLVTYSILTLTALIIFPSGKAVTLEERTGAYSTALQPLPITEEIPLKDIFFDQGEFRLREDANPVL